MHAKLAIQLAMPENYQSGYPVTGCLMKRDNMEAVNPLLPVLVVDDDDAMRYGLARELKKCGCTVHECASVDEALEQLTKQNYSVVFSDMRFPGGKDGDELLEVTLDQYPATEVILVSCAMDSKRKADLVAKGASLCLQKPIYKDHCIAAFSTLAVELQNAA